MTTLGPSCTCKKLTPLQWALLAAAIAIALSMTTGCAQMFTAKTKATYTALNGTQVSYESDKEQVGLDVVYEVDEKGNVKKIHLKVDKSGTQESVIAAVAEQQKAIAEILKTLVPLAAKAAGGISFQQPINPFPWITGPETWTVSPIDNDSKFWTILPDGTVSVPSGMP